MFFNKLYVINNRTQVPNAGIISPEQAVEKAHQEYDYFRIEQDKNYISDLDRELKRLNNK